MSVNDSEQLNQSASITKAAAKKSARAAGKGAKKGAEGAKKVFSLLPLKWKLIILAAIILLIIIAVVFQGTSSSSFRRVSRTNAINEDNDYNRPKTEDEAESSIYDINMAREDTVKLVNVIHKAREKDTADIESLLHSAVSSKAGQLKKNGTDIDVDLSLAQAKREEAEGSNYVYVQGGVSTDAESKLKILLVGNDYSNQRLAKRFEKEDCEVITVFEKSQIDPTQYDALVISGVACITPSLYGKKAAANAPKTNQKKDDLQIYAVKKFADKKKPVLGLGRGMQIVNVAFGGTIDQDIIDHKGWSKVSFEGDSWFKGIYGKKIKAYHNHKQQVGKVASKFKVTMQSKQGGNRIIEGMEHKSLPIYCAQWLPDALKMGDNGQKTIKAFVDAVKEFKGSGALDDSEIANGMTISPGGQKSSNPAIQGAIDWATMIANDDSYTYGHGTPKCCICRHMGIKQFTCMPFLAAAYAHGGKDPTLMEGKRHMMYLHDGNFKGKYAKVWKKVGTCRELTINDLEPGDVVIKWSGNDDNGHAWMYGGDNKVIEAVPAGIHVVDGAAKKLKDYRTETNEGKAHLNYVMRYIGQGTGTPQAASQSLPTYDKVTTIKTLSKSSGKRYHLNTPASKPVAQSFAYADGTFAVAFTDGPQTGTAGIVQGFSEDCKPISGSSVTANIYHANGTCATEDGSFFVAGALKSGREKKAVGISQNNGMLKSAGIKTLPETTSAMAYDKDTKRYILATGTTIRIYDTDLKAKISQTARNMHGQYYQDVGAGGGYIYACHSVKKGGENSGENYVDIYNESSGDYCGSYSVPYGELESAEVVNGELVLLVHIKGSSSNYIHFTGITAPGVGGSGANQAGISVLDMDILSAYNISLSNTDLFMDPENTKEEGERDGWLDSHGYSDVSGKNLPIYWFGKNRGLVNYEKDLRRKLNKIIKGSPVETDSSESITIDKPDATKWSLLLVNSDNKIPSGYHPELSTIDGSYLTKNDSWRKYIDSRVYKSLMKMMDDCRNAGYKPLICSAYRTNEQQKELYDAAENKNDTAVPGTSEHECGLAVDIVDSEYRELDDAQADTGTQKWLMKHCQDYGFILRYPEGKQSVTGIIYEPWHYRYVGKTDAGKIMEYGCTLEEYLEGTFETEKKKESKTKHFYRIVVGTNPEKVETTDADGKKTTKYIVPVTVKESDVEDLMEPLFGLDPNEYYTNSKTQKTAKIDEAEKNGTEADSKETNGIISVPGGSATNLTATYTLSGNTGRILFGDPQIALKQELAIGTGQFKMPLPAGSFQVTSHFTNGKIRTDVNTGRSHDGVDLGAAEGTPIYASLPGTVTKAEFYGGYGNCVIIQTGDVEIKYAHMSKILCSKGSSISAGQLIGLVGNTGNSFGAHLHFEVIKGGKLQDPEVLLGLKSE